jgi:hypothetical protein
MDAWIKGQLEGEGLRGTVFYNENDEQFELNQNMVDIGLCGIFQYYEGKKVKVFVEVLD